MGSPTLNAGLDNHIPPAVPATAASFIAAAAGGSDQIIVFVLAASASHCGGLGEVSPSRARGIAARIRFGESA